MPAVIDASPTAPVPHPTDSANPGRRRKVRSRAQRRRRRRRIAIVVVVAVLPAAWSYVGYLTAPGSEPLAVRSVDWLRDHGFESIVNRIENWYYTRTKPTGNRPSRGDLPPTVAARPPSEPVPSAASTTTTLPGGAGWQDVGGLAVQPAAIQQSFVIPDPVFPSVAVGLVRIDQRAVRTVYVPGLREPGGLFQWGGGIPVAERPRLVAAFNAGFKMKHITGGVWTEGRSAGHPLEDGQASVDIHRDGHVTIDQWGRDTHMSPDLVSVRQNLALIVDRGRAVPDLLTDRTHKWGTFNSQLQYTWRSGLGIDAQGRLIYAAGREMRITQLAAALVDAGAVRAMELDIHNQVVTFNWFRHAGGRLFGTRLLPSMNRPPDRFLAPDWRDFFVVQAK